MNHIDYRNMNYNCDCETHNTDHISVYHANI